MAFYSLFIVIFTRGKVMRQLVIHSQSFAMIKKNVVGVLSVSLQKGSPNQQTVDETLANKSGHKYRCKETDFKAKINSK